ncbi:MAG: PEGA domain-containing protein [Planctomycetes bacterium]|nr:PEGA domain-containing protein [Planctomycetota bacterium]
MRTLSLAGALVWICVTTAPARQVAKQDQFDAAGNACKELLAKKDTFAMDLAKKKITPETIQSDFEDLRKILATDEGKLLMRAMTGIEAKDNQLPQNADEMKDLLITIWVTWRVDEAKGGLKSVLADLSKFVKVHFKSDPSEAAVTVNGAERGKTPRVVYMTRDGKHALRMAKDGYEPWDKSDYTPGERGDKFEEKLKKKP